MTETKTRQMKPSGVPWLGDIPVGWDVIRNKNCFACSKEIVGTDSGDTQLLSLTTAGIKTKGRDVLGGKLPESFDTYQIVRKNNLVMCLFDMDCSAVFSGVSPFDGMISPAYKVLTCKARVDSQFTDYWFRFIGSDRVFMHYAKNIRHSLTYEDFADLPFLLPPLPEQRAIADFLDEKCAAIDAIVEEAKSGIEEYAKWKQSVVFQAVTKGLDPHAKMKDSGVEWIGEIPEEWKVSRVKNEFDCLDYLREPISAENRENKLGLYDYYGASGVIDKIDHYNVDDRVLLIGEDGANLRLRNLPLVYRASGKFWVNNHAHILKEKDGNDYGYFAYALEAGDYNPVITGSAQPKLSQSNLMAFPIAVPPLPEQRAIAVYLDEKCSAIDALISEKKNLIEDLGTYKKSLIYETVTGKRSVAK